MSGHFLKNWELFFGQRMTQVHRRHLRSRGRWNPTWGGRVLPREGCVTGFWAWQGSCGCSIETGEGDEMTLGERECPKHPEVSPWRSPHHKVSYTTLRTWSSATSSPDVLSSTLLLSGETEGRDASRGPSAGGSPPLCTLTQNRKPWKPSASADPFSNLLWLSRSS